MPDQHPIHEELKEIFRQGGTGIGICHQCAIYRIGICRFGEVVGRTNLDRGHGGGDRLGTNR